MRGANLVGLKIDRYASLPGCSFSNADFEEVDLAGGHMAASKMDNTKFRGGK
jgi:uncharacterized protein YjbI with pentapeptide repeats